MHHDQQQSNHIHLFGNQNQLCSFFLLNLPLPFLASCFSCLCALPNQVSGHNRHVFQTAREDFWFKPPTSRKKMRFSQEMTGREPRAACEKVTLHQKVHKGIKKQDEPTGKVRDLQSSGGDRGKNSSVLLFLLTQNILLAWIVVHSKHAHSLLRL